MNMELVIKISEDLYKATINGLHADEIWDLRQAVANGTLLSKEIWVPVSERLPKDDRDYLVTKRGISGRPVVTTRCFIKDLFKFDEYKFWDKKGISGWCDYDSEYGYYIDDKVIAWCELPEPYKAEGSNS